jgi:hypothetical protein
MADTIYKALYNQNQQIKENAEKIKDKNSTDDQKNTYETPKNELFTTLNTVFFYSYFALLVVVAYQLIFKVKEPIYKRGIIALLFVIYPFVCKYVFKFLHWAFRYFGAIINGTVFVV